MSTLLAKFGNLVVFASFRKLSQLVGFDDLEMVPGVKFMYRNILFATAAFLFCGTGFTATAGFHKSHLG